MENFFLYENHRTLSEEISVVHRAQINLWYSFLSGENFLFPSVFVGWEKGQKDLAVFGIHLEIPERQSIQLFGKTGENFRNVSFFLHSPFDQDLRLFLGVSRTWNDSHTEDQFTLGIGISWEKLSFSFFGNRLEEEETSLTGKFGVNNLLNQKDNLEFTDNFDSKNSKLTNWKNRIQEHFKSNHYVRASHPRGYGSKLKLYIALYDFFHFRSGIVIRRFSTFLRIENFPKELPFQKRIFPIFKLSTGKRTSQSFRSLEKEKPNFAEEITMGFRFILIDSLKVRTVFLDHLLSNFQEARFANNKIFFFRIQSIHISFLIYSVLLKYLTSVVKSLSRAQNPVLLSERSSLKIFSLLLIMSATSVRPVESRIGATFETYESRYSHTSKENWFFKISNCGMKQIPLSYNLPQNSEPLLLDTPFPKVMRSNPYRRTKNSPAQNQTGSNDKRQREPIRSWHNSTVSVYDEPQSGSNSHSKFQNCFTGFAETRNGTPLLSGKVDQKFFRASLGHRFRPLENFYFLRDNDFYTALPEIEQGIHKAGFFGLKWKEWSLGTYFSEQEAKHKPGIYLLSPLKLFEFAYSPEMKKHYASLNFQSKNFFLAGPKIVSRIQTFGERKEIDGTFYSSATSEKFELKLTGYRGKNEDLFALDPDRKELKGKAELVRLGFISHSIFNLEWIRAWSYPLRKQSDSGPEAEKFQPFNPTIPESDSKRWEIIAGKAPIFYDPFWGGIFLSLRNYTNETLGRGIYYGLYKKRFTIEAGQEWRINGDKITEGKWSFRMNETWNLEGAFLFQKEGNHTDSLFEARTTRDETSSIFTDRSSSFRLRLLSPYVALTVSHSRKKESKNDSIWINLQTQFYF